MRPRVELMKGTETPTYTHSNNKLLIKTTTKHYTRRWTTTPLIQNLFSKITCLSRPTTARAQQCSQVRPPGAPGLRSRMDGPGGTRPWLPPLLHRCNANSRQEGSCSPAVPDAGQPWAPAKQADPPEGELWCSAMQWDRHLWGNGLCIFSTHWQAKHHFGMKWVGKYK